MKIFWKVFSVSFVFFLFAIILGSYSYIKTEGDGNKDSDIKIIGETVESQDEEQPVEEQLTDEGQIPKEKESYKSLEEAFKKSNRINIVVMGMEGVRTDTIVFISFDPDNKELNAISIPRDTYIHRKGYDLAEQRKINAIYESHGANGVKETISYIFKGVTIDHHIIVDYEGVEKIVDSIGGVEVIVPFHMKYDDPSANPPLHIDLKPGRQVLYGKEALQFLRYRKGYIDGDLGRIKAQQEFFKAFAKKAMSYRLPVVIKNIYQYVETDISLFEALYYGTKALDIDVENIKFTTLPGKAEFRRYNGKLLSYFIFNPTEAEKLLMDIYNVKKTPK